MYSIQPSLLLGFHGTDKKVAYDIVNHITEMRPSTNSYDWLGYGMYFWEGNYERAKQYATEDSLRKESNIEEPYVVGAAIDLQNCFDLLNQKHIDFLKVAYDNLVDIFSEEHISIPENLPFSSSDFDFKRRELDCAVIREALRLAAEHGVYFDSVRAAFLEGNPLYEGAGFRMYNHIQLSIINPDCIKGFFLPREKDSDWANPYRSHIHHA